MLEGFTLFADWLVYGVLKMPKTSQAALSFHFFIEDIIKIFVLLILDLLVLRVDNKKRLINLLLICLSLFSFHRLHVIY